MEDRLLVLGSMTRVHIYIAACTSGFSRGD